MFSLIVYWKILNKTDKKNGWKLLIPFYGQYTLFKKFYDVKLYWTLFISYIVAIAFGIFAVSSCYNELFALVQYIRYFGNIQLISWKGFPWVLPVTALLALSIVLFLDYVLHVFLKYYIGRSFKAKPIHCLCMVLFPIFAGLVIALDDRFTYKGSGRVLRTKKKMPVKKTVKKIAKPTEEKTEVAEEN